jgi:hypothetical protein
MFEVRRHVRRAHRKTGEERKVIVNAKYVDPEGFRRLRPRIYREERGGTRMHLKPLCYP